MELQLTQALSLINQPVVVPIRKQVKREVRRILHGVQICRGDGMKNAVSARYGVMEIDGDIGRECQARSQPEHDAWRATLQPPQRRTQAAVGASF
jgi:hypothetical protein